jgi:hypothetical protein
MPAKNSEHVTIRVSVKLEASHTGETAPKAVAYGFSGAGRLIARAAVDDAGSAVLTLPAGRSPREVRVVVGPEIQQHTVTLSDLTRRSAQQQFLKISAESKVLQAIFNIPSPIWLCWIRFCFVQGTLLKRLLNAGIPVDYPVYPANVQIWEVEPIFIILSKISDPDLENVRRFLLNPQPLPPRFSRQSTGRAQFGRLEIAEPVSTLERFSPASPELASLRAAAESGDLRSLQQAMINSDESLIRFIICLLFPRWVFKRLIATVPTDRCGRFSTYVILSCYETVNLYFTAFVNFGYIDINIYNPTPIGCYTFWNYQCGADLTLYTNSSFAPLSTPCAPINAPENYVLFRAIGNVQLNDIYGASQPLSGVTTPANTGLAANLYGAGWDSPFGNQSLGAIYPRVEFDSSLRASNLAMYYQISYRKGTSGSFNVLSGAVNRKYNHFVGTTLVTSVYNLGPKTVGSVPNLFEIPTELPAGEGLEGDWAYPNPPVDLANAVLDTSGFTPGQYQLQLELFDSSGAPVNIASAGIGYFVPTTVEPDGSIDTANAATLGLVSGNSFIMTLYVDNRPTTGSISLPQLNGASADSCGVLRYGPGYSGTVTLQYTATQPGNFAIFLYQLSRGGTELVPPSVGYQQVSASTDPAVVNASVLSLLTQPDGTICNVAGFAESLNVASLTTDGWNRIEGYDSNPPPVGFVLAPAV